ncbi:MAG: class I SAM-dependent RNA methyltransferase [Spirochaetaceae bacterium]|jgi:23S rRNA (uracil1939-C5)-methyltransferase|nr:class I SAM-dependent RNA methyltransferase [Spirochaetaceae bacterium]
MAKKKNAQEPCLRGVVERIASNGCGVVRCGTEKLFVHGTIPGETIICAKDPHSKFSGTLVDLCTVSPDRVDSVCPYYGVCGGCSLRHLEYSAQLRQKTAIVRDSFFHVGGLRDIPEITVFTSAPDGYRDRAQLHRAPPRPVPRGRLLRTASMPGQEFGFMGRDSNTVIPVTDCLVLNDTVRTALQKGAFTPPLDKDRFKIYGREGVLLCEGGISRRRFVFHSGKIAAALTVDAGLFFQSNGALFEQLAGRLLEFAAGVSGQNAGDFYAGSGAFSVFLRHRFSHISLLEKNRAALALARENLCGKPEGRFNFYPLTDSQWVKLYGTKSSAFDFLCLDPGRQGISPLMRRWLCEHPPALLAYVSCEPSSLARDARQFAASGLHLTALELFDFYPQTPRIEMLAIFIPPPVR